MYNLNEFSERSALDVALADKVSTILINAVKTNGKASIAVSGGSTPKGFFNELSQRDLPWKQITVTLADERWVEIDDEASNTKLVFENLLQNKAAQANFFHLKQGKELTLDTLADLNLAAQSTILPFDVLILGMGEDGHTASLFPCSDEIEACLADSTPALLKVTPKTAPHDRISFSFASLKKSKNIVLHISGVNKKQVMEKAISEDLVAEMPIRAFLNHPSLQTEVYWAE